jgi:23S rRNA (cytosine1962-C5)-methyltransferase
LAEPYPTLRLKPGRDKSLRQRHPWIFSGAVAAADDAWKPGDTVTVQSSDGAFLAHAAYSPTSQIVRVPGLSIRAKRSTADFFARRIGRAVAARASMLDESHTGCRLVHGESDGLPGIVADRYADTVVLQLTSAGASAGARKSSTHSPPRQVRHVSTSARRRRAQARGARAARRCGEGHAS